MFWFVFRELQAKSHQHLPYLTPLLLQRDRHGSDASNIGLIDVSAAFGTTGGFTRNIVERTIWYKHVRVRLVSWSSFYVPWDCDAPGVTPMHSWCDGEWWDVLGSGEKYWGGPLLPLLDDLAVAEAMAVLFCCCCLIYLRRRAAGGVQKDLWVLIWVE